MLFQNEALHLTREHIIPTHGSSNFDDSFLSVRFRHNRPRSDQVAYLHRLEEAYIGTAQHHIRVVYGKHGSIVSKTKDKSSMDQTLLVNSHAACCFEKY